MNLLLTAHFVIVDYLDRAPIYTCTIMYMYVHCTLCFIHECVHCHKIMCSHVHMYSRTHARLVRTFACKDVLFTAGTGGKRRRLRRGSKQSVPLIGQAVAPGPRVRPCEEGGSHRQIHGDTEGS